VASRFTELIVDAADPSRLADFWRAVLGWEVLDEEDGVVEIGASPGSPPTIVFVPVPEPKTVKNRLHIDVNPSGCDQAEEVERLLALGARRVDIGQGRQNWVVLADPEGNEFCVLQRRVD
jgi:catechol 2,3-dioxygenase-like lactoylglutathione lyase family enzyme